MNTFKTPAWGASGSLIGGKTLEPMEVERTDPQPGEVLIDVLYCGVCHSDIHQVNNDWKNTIYPCVPGHEVVGRVVRTGDGVVKYKVGDIVGVGCMIDSCGHCDPCHEQEEQFCEGPVGATMTYNGYFNPKDSKFNTFGGYSTQIVANEKFVMTMPHELDMAAAAPILCAGVTTYGPLKRANIKAGDKVGIVGIGGLGHMAIKIAKAMGAEVTAITTMEEKSQAARELGADKVLVSENKEDMKQFDAYFNFILVTIPDSFDINPYVCLIRRHGALVTVGLLAPYKSGTNNMEVAKLDRTIGGSLIGGTAETQEVLDFCARHNIVPDVEIIPIQEINNAFQRIMDEDIRFRFVIDMRSLK